MKKIIALFTGVVLCASLLVACGRSGESSEGKLSIVTTIFPEYDWVRAITKGNDNVQITMLLDKGVDLHSFQPTADDIVKIASCDMFIYVGGESDEWVESALASSGNKEINTINLLEVLGDSVKEEELVEGMQEEHEHDAEGHDEAEHDVDEHDESGHGADEHDGAEHDAESEYDEHVWLSLRNAVVLCNHITEELVKIDAEHKSLYEANAKAYADELRELDGKYEETVRGASVKTVVFADRFPFRYMTDDYGLDYYAAFAGCSAESEAGFETITFLAGKLDELKLNAILQIESADGKIAQTVKSITAQKDQQILTMNSLQSVTSADIAKGAEYLKLMTDNLEVLSQALQ